nr:single-stranded DNA-binding protein [uncultured Cohaesibacter sp.]
MAGSINKAILIGHLGADPDIRTIGQGRTIASFSLATSKNWKDQGTGERRERTEWHRVVIFNENLAKLAQQYLKKGSKAYLEGELATRKWTDSNGVDRYTTEVVLQGFSASLTMLDSKGAECPPPAEPGAYGDIPPDPDETQYAGY